MRHFTLTCLIFLCLCSSGCVYRLDVQQGNLISRRDAQQLKLGMSKQQVVNLLGNPVLNDPFSTDRWTYVYTFKKGRGKMTKKSMTLYFTASRLTHIVGGYSTVPSG